MSERRTPQAFERGKIGPLIEQLGPLNNHWRDAIPGEKVLTLWDMGEVLICSYPKASDSLLWEIQKRSYITRNVLRYALILRRSWTDRSELEKLTQGLKSYTVFREALPFLKGDRQGISEATYHKVVSLLHNADTQSAARYLKNLAARNIGRQHKKGASLTAVRAHAIAFDQALTEIETAILADLKASVTLTSVETLISVSRASLAIATNDVVEDLTSVVLISKGNMHTLASTLATVSQGGRESINAFRKIIGAERLMLAADLLSSMRAEKTLEQWRHRHSANSSISRANTFGANV
jgi:hypothetical protein